jgi:hypothetical protein
MLDSLYPVYGIWLSLYGILQNISNLCKLQTIENRNNKGEKDMFTKKDREIIELKKKLGKYESDLEIKSIEADNYKKKLELKEVELNEKDIEYKDAKSLKKERDELKTKVEKIKFETDNDTKNIELQTENSKLQSELKVAKSEAIYLKKLLDTYQELPDVKRMIENLSSLAVPNIEEIKKFAEVLNNGKTNDLVTLLKENNGKLDNVANYLMRVTGSRY